MFCLCTFCPHIILPCFLVCPSPVLTLDLRGSCSPAGEQSSSRQVVWDIVPLNSPSPSTPGSADGFLAVEGGGCPTVPVTVDVAVGINNAAPVGDLYLLMIFDLRGCTFNQGDPPLNLILDTDTTEEAVCNTAPPTLPPTLPPIGMVCMLLTLFSVLNVLSFCF